MTLLIIASIVLLILFLCALADIFWPITVAVGLGLIAASWMGSLALLWMLWHPWMIAAYFGAAFIWIAYRWHLLVGEALQEAMHYEANSLKKPPIWSKYSSDFAAYFFYWPFDLLAYIVRDLLRDIWRGISDMVATSFNRYAEYRFRNIKQGDSK